MLRPFLILLLATFTLTGCAPFDGRGEWVPIPQEAKRPCPDPKSDPFPTSGSHNEVEAWAVRWGLKYRACMDGKADLVDAVNRREREDE